MPRVHKFLEDHIDMNKVDMVGDPVTTRSPDGTVTTNANIICSGTQWSWSRTGESGVTEVARAHAELIRIWKSMDEHSVDDA